MLKISVKIEGKINKLLEEVECTETLIELYNMAEPKLKLFYEKCPPNVCERLHYCRLHTFTLYNWDNGFVHISVVKCNKGFCN